MRSRSVDAASTFHVFRRLSGNRAMPKVAVAARAAVSGATDGVIVSSHVSWAVWSEQIQMRSALPEPPADGAGTASGGNNDSPKAGSQLRWAELPPLHSPEQEEVRMQERVGLTFVLAIVGGCVLATHGAVAVSDFQPPLPTVLLASVYSLAGVATLCLWLLLHTLESSATIQRSAERCLPIPPTVEALLLQGLPLSYADLNLRKLQCMDDATGQCSFDAVRFGPELIENRSKFYLIRPKLTSNWSGRSEVRNAPGAAGQPQRPSAGSASTQARPTILSGYAGLQTTSM